MEEIHIGVLHQENRDASCVWSKRIRCKGVVQQVAMAGTWRKAHHGTRATAGLVGVGCVPYGWSKLS